MNRDEKKRIERLVREGEQLAVHLSNKYSAASGLKSEDLYTYALEGLVLAAKKYNPSSGVKFTSFAFNRVRGCIINSFRKFSPVPYRVQNLYFHGQSQRKKQPHLSEEELCQLIDLTPEQWNNCCLAMKYYYYRLHISTRARLIDGVNKYKAADVPELATLLRCFGFDSNVNNRKSGRKYIEIPPSIKNSIIELRKTKKWGSIRISKHLNIKRSWVDKVLTEELGMKLYS